MRGISKAWGNAGHGKEEGLKYAWLRASAIPDPLALGLSVLYFLSLVNSCGLELGDCDGINDFFLFLNFLIKINFVLATPNGLWYLSSMTRDWALALTNESSYS